MYHKRVENFKTISKFCLTNRNFESCEFDDGFLTVNGLPSFAIFLEKSENANFPVLT